MQITSLGQPDPRGPIQTVIDIRDREGGHYYLDLDCGHAAKVVGHFSYRVGQTCRCYACGKESTRAWFAMHAPENTLATAQGSQS